MSDGYCVQQRRCQIHEPLTNLEPRRRPAVAQTAILRLGAIAAWLRICQPSGDHCPLTGIEMAPLKIHARDKTDRVVAWIVEHTRRNASFLANAVTIPSVEYTSLVQNNGRVKPIPEDV